MFANGWKKSVRNGRKQGKGDFGVKVLQVNCVYAEGSTGKITQDIHRSLLEKGHESVVCYGRGNDTQDPGVIRLCSNYYGKANNLLSRFTGLMYGGCYFSTNKLIRVIREEKPDVVHLQCINGYFVNIYRLVTWLKKQGIKTVLTLHAEFMFTANCGYALDCDRWRAGCGRCPRRYQETKSLFVDGTAWSYRMMQRAFYGFEDYLTVVSVSPWLKNRAEQSPILAGKHHCVVFNGVDTEVFHPFETADLRKKHGLTDEKILFHATPFFSGDPEHIKGGYYILQMAEMLAEQNVRIFVAGDHAPGLLVPPNVTLLGRIQDQRELARYYSMADVTVLTSKKETFSMVTAESLCCGTPVVGFRAGGPEQIALEAFSKFVPWGNVRELSEAAEIFMDDPVGDIIIAECSAKAYSKNTMAEGYMALYAD